MREASPEVGVEFELDEVVRSLDVVDTALARPGPESVAPTRARLIGAEAGHGGEVGELGAGSAADADAEKALDDILTELASAV